MLAFSLSLNSLSNCRYVCSIENQSKILLRSASNPDLEVFYRDMMWRECLSTLATRLAHNLCSQPVVVTAIQCFDSEEKLRLLINELFVAELISQSDFDTYNKWMTEKEYVDILYDLFEENLGKSSSKRGIAFYEKLRLGAPKLKSDKTWYDANVLSEMIEILKTYESQLDCDQLESLFTNAQILKIFLILERERGLLESGSSSICEALLSGVPLKKVVCDMMFDIRLSCGVFR